jgi:hypothetical protein
MTDFPEREGIAEPVLLLAEDSNADTPLGPGSERIEGDGYVFFLGAMAHPAAKTVQRLRLAHRDVSDVVHEVRAIARDRGVDAYTWEVSTSATPDGLVDRLLELGLERYEEPLAVAMVLDREPEPGPPDVETREVTTAEDWLEGNRIAAIAFGGEHDSQPRETLEEAAEKVREMHEAGTGSQFLAVVDGRPVATAWATYTPHGVVLNGGSTLPEARGRGAYRALVAARWAAAVERGTPAMVTQAGAMSRPILRRLGFREVAEIHILLDRP